MDKTLGFTELVRGVVGAVLGAVLGYSVFVWMLRHGYYALVLPGTMLGLGFGLCSGRKSVGWGVGCGVCAVVAGFFSEWRTAPFVDDDGLLFFLTHVSQLPTRTIVLIVLGGLFAFWFGMGRDRRDSRCARPIDRENDGSPPDGDPE